VNGAPAQQVFTAIVTGTRYSMLLPPELSGSITVSLKDVTVRDALDALRELYGYEYRIQGNRIHVQPNTLQSRIYQINYLAGRRQGVTDISVSSGSISRSTGASGTPSRRRCDADRLRPARRARLPRRGDPSRAAGYRLRIRPTSGMS
jgi:MSHA biogenesis protein MshL